MQNLRKITATIAVLVIMSGYTVLAEARCIGVFGYFGPSGLVTGIDEYKTVCPVNTAYLRARISKKSGTAGVPMSLKVAKGSVFVNTSDSSTAALTQCDGAGNLYIGSGAGSYVINTAGAGQYVLTVSSTAKPANYAMEFHCMTSTGFELTPATPVIPGCVGNFDVCRSINQ
jgi:hypothetical protein